MGGFLWRWANNGLRTKTADGLEIFGYRGDFGDFPNDRAILINGICTSAHEPSPTFGPYQKAIQPCRVDGDTVVLQSRYDFISLDHLRCHWSLVSELVPDGAKHEINIPQDINPHAKIELVIPALPGPFSNETYVNPSFTTRHVSPEGPAGHQIAWEQARISEPTNSVMLGQSLRTQAAAAVAAGGRAAVEKIDNTALKITSSMGSSVWTIDLTQGLVVSWIHDGFETIARPLTMDLWRATTEPDRRSYGLQWLDRRVHQTQYTARQVEWSDTDHEGRLTVRMHGRVGPPVQAWAIALVTTFTIQGDHVNVAVQGRMTGPNFPDTLPRIGRRPGESYIDKKSHQPFGVWSSTVDDLWVEYEEPKESGNRTDVRLVGFLGDSSERRLRASFGVREGCSFAASHYQVEDVAAAGHPFELTPNRKAETLIRLDWQHQGVGSGLIETGTVEEEWKLKLRDFEFSIDLD